MERDLSIITAITQKGAMGSMRKTIENHTFDEERALYGSEGILAKRCRFDGPADGESAFKESTDIRIEDCYFNLRYPFWHDRHLEICDSEMTEACRAPLWYSEHIAVTNTKIHGIKAMRECHDVAMEHCDIVSPEFGWSVRTIRMRDYTAESEYFLMRAGDMDLSNVALRGKYSFQYIEDAVFDNCRFDTKDAFWHAKNVTVRDSVIKGEYLAWYSEGLTLVHCRIIGTQPFCYCKGLKLVDCEMIDADLCFEKSEVEAVVTTPVISIKNPLAGTITVPAVGQQIMDDPHAKGRILIRPDGKCFCA